MIVAKHFDMVVGMDIHINLIPAPTPIPTPLPHVYSGIIIDLPDYLPFFGQTLWVNGLPAAQPMTECKFFPQFPMAGPFPKPPEAKGEAVTGSMTVGTVAMTLTQMAGLAKMAGEWAVHKMGGPPPPPPPPDPPPPPPPTMVNPISRLGDIALGCADVGPPAPKNKNKKGGVKGLTFVAGVIMAIPGKPVLAGGPPFPAPPSAFLMRFAMKFAMKKLAKLLGKAGKAIRKKLTDWNLARKANKGPNKISALMCKLGLEPIDLASGMMLTERNDFALPGPIPLEWDCIYYTTSNYKGALGLGWHHKYDMSLSIVTLEGELSIRLRMYDGRYAYFPELEIGEHFLDRQDRIELLRDQKGYYVRDENRLLYRFHESDESPKWPLASVADDVNNDILFHYDDQQTLTSIRDSAGRNLKVDTDAKGKILAIHAPHPEIAEQTFALVRYSYDEKDRLTGATDPLDQTFKYIYEGLLMVQLTYRNGLSFYYTYDRDDHEAKCIHSHGDGGLYNGDIVYEEGKTILTRIVAQKDGSEDRYTETYFHEEGLVLKEIDALGNEKSYTYSDNLELLTETNALGQNTSYRYDNRGNIKEITYADKNKVSLRYSKNDLLLEAIDQMGGKWQWKYDDRNLLTQRIDCMERSTTYHYNEAGQVTELVDPAGGRTLIGYNSFGAIEQITTPDNASSRWEYDQLGRITKAIDPKGNAEVRHYDLLGQVTQLNAADGNRIKILYDSKGNVISYKDRQRDIQFDYYGLGELASRTENNTTVQFQYNTDEQLTSIVNEHGSVYKFDLDANGKVEIESGFDGIRRHYQRNANGSVTRLSRASGIESRYDYDPVGRIIAIRHSNGEEERFTYQEDGELVTATNANSEVQYTRDPLGRVLRENQNGFSVFSEYDPLGLRSKVSSSLGLDVQLMRNNMGDVLQIQAKQGNTPWQMQFKRDIMGLEMERLFSNGVKGQWERDRLGRPVQHKVFSKGGSKERDRVYEWDVNYRIKKFIDFGSEVTQFQHDKVGNLAAATYPDGQTELRMPDAVGNLFKDTSQKDRKYGPAGQLLEANGTKYTYDAEGNLIKKTTAKGETWHYHWNATGMLSRVDRPDGEAVSFTYDALGRRLSKTFKKETTYWVWDGNVPVHEWTQRGDAPSFSAAPAKVPEMEMEAEEKDEIIFFEIKNTGSPSGASTTTTQSDIVFQETESDTIVAPPETSPLVSSLPMPAPQALVTWLFEPETFAPIGKMIGDQHFSIQTDHLGTPVSMYDKNGKRVWAGSLNTYGALSLQEGTAQMCPFRFPGQYEDVETGLYYNRFRYYDAEMGGYVSQDPIRLKSGQPNLYSYVKNTSTWVDIFGLATLFRSMSREEYFDIKENGWREAPEGSMSGKWFAEDMVSAEKFGANLDHGPDSKYYIVEVEIPDDIAEGLHSQKGLDGVKSTSKYAEVDTLNKQGKIKSVHTKRVKC